MGKSQVNTNTILGFPPFNLKSDPLPALSGGPPLQVYTHLPQALPPSSAVSRTAIFRPDRHFHWPGSHHFTNTIQKPGFWNFANLIGEKTKTKNGTMVQLELKSCWFDPEIPFLTTAIDTHDPATQLCYAAVSSSKSWTRPNLLFHGRRSVSIGCSPERKLPKDTTVRRCWDQQVVCVPEPRHWLLHWPLTRHSGAQDPLPLPETRLVCVLSLFTCHTKT